MSTDYRLLRKVPACDLFDGRLEEFGIREHVKPEATTEKSRLLMDGRNYMWAYVDDDGFVGCLTRYAPNGAPGKILNALANVFDTDIVSEYEPQFWGFDTQEEWDACMEKMSQKAEEEIIAPDPDVAPIISKLFDWYATGRLSLKEAAYKARDAGLVYRKSGAKVPVSTVHSILRNRIYTGWFEWNGKMIQDRHEPLVSVELWERVQAVMDGRFAKKHRRMTHDFAFSGLIACSKCCCSAVGEIKKQRYVYYHCTGYADKCKGNPATCRRKYVREEVLEQQFTSLLGRLHFDDEVLSWVQEALRASHADKRREQEEAIARLRAEYDRLQRRLDTMYVDRLDGRVDAAFFDKMAAEWRAEQWRCQREIDQHQEADKSYMDEGAQILELARNAQQLFERQEPRQKRRLLNFVLSNCTWEDGEVVATFREPFDLLAETTAIAARSAVSKIPNLTK